jgi:hypothetical protein
MRLVICACTRTQCMLLYPGSALVHPLHAHAQLRSLTVSRASCFLSMHSAGRVPITDYNPAGCGVLHRCRWSVLLQAHPHITGTGGATRGSAGCWITHQRKGVIKRRTPGQGQAHTGCPATQALGQKSCVDGTSNVLWLPPGDMSSGHNNPKTQKAPPTGDLFLAPPQPPPRTCRAHLLASIWALLPHIYLLLQCGRISHCCD